MSKKNTKPFHFFYLKVDSVNEIYVRQFGDKNGVPIIILHGGPGGDHENSIGRLVNLKKTNLIVIDQRGCGKSKPHLSMHKTSDLISDIKKVKQHLKINKFIITGGSWGAILSLLYTIKYPKDIISYVLCCGTYQYEKTVWTKSLLSMYPDKWEDFTSLVNLSGKKNNKS